MARSTADILFLLQTPAQSVTCLRHQRKYAAGSTTTLAVILLLSCFQLIGKEVAGTLIDYQHWPEVDRNGLPEVDGNHGRRLEAAVAAPDIDPAAKVPSTSAETHETNEAAEQKYLVRGFDAFDANHNGQIDRSEFDHGVEKLISFLGDESVSVSTGGKLSSIHLPSFKAPAAAGTPTKQADDEKFWPAFVHSAMMIIATEVGDKTFFIAAVLAMRNSRSAIFSGAFFALVCMTILSTMMGLILPSILPRQYTSIFGGLLFLYFGQKLLRESWGMTHHVSDELEEVEEELLGHHPTKKQDAPSDLENGTSKVVAAPGSGVANSLKKKDSDRNVVSNGSTGFGATAHSWEKVFVQSLTLTFLAEWGDRSQIATIALAAHKDPYGVTFGGCLGHFLCTGVAVIGGRMLAAKISEKTVAMSGGVIFLLFGVHSLVFEA